MEIGLFQLVAAGLTIAWVVISFILDKKTGTSVLSYAMFVFGVVLYELNQVFWGSIAVLIGTCTLVIFFLIYKNEHMWNSKNKDKEKEDKE